MIAGMHSPWPLRFGRHVANSDSSTSSGTVSARIFSAGWNNSAASSLRWTWTQSSRFAWSEVAAPRFQVDEFRVEQVFRNLLENSLAACTDPVNIDILCDETEIDRTPAVLITYRDNGPGLSAEQKRRIFEPFFTTKSKGTGLGMAIAKRILEAHGAQVRVGHDCRTGAEFRIVLPRESRG